MTYQFTCIIMLGINVCLCLGATLFLTAPQWTVFRWIHGDMIHEDVSFMSCINIYLCVVKVLMMIKIDIAHTYVMFISACVMRHIMSNTYKYLHFAHNMLVVIIFSPHSNIPLSTLYMYQYILYIYMVFTYDWYDIMYLKCELYMYSGII